MHAIVRTGFQLSVRSPAKIAGAALDDDDDDGGGDGEESGGPVQPISRFSASRVRAASPTRGEHPVACSSGVPEYVRCAVLTSSGYSSASSRGCSRAQNSRRTPASAAAAVLGAASVLFWPPLREAGASPTSSAPCSTSVSRSAL